MGLSAPRLGQGRFRMVLQRKPERRTRMAGWVVLNRAEGKQAAMNGIESEYLVSQSAAGSAATTPERMAHKSARGRWRWLALPLGLLAVFYAVVGYFGSGLFIGDHPRWRGMNKGPGDLGLQSEVVGFAASDGVALKAWWLPAEGAPNATVIIAHGVDHTRQVVLGRAAFLVHGGYKRWRWTCGGTARAEDGLFPRDWWRRAICWAQSSMSADAGSAVRLC